MMKLSHQIADRVINNMFLIRIDAINFKDYEKETCFVDRIIDGDTIECFGDKFRLLGVYNKEG